MPETLVYPVQEIHCIFMMYEYDGNSLCAVNMRTSMRLRSPPAFASIATGD